MKLAVAYNNGDISLGFGHTKEFKVYEIKEGKINGSCILETSAEGHLELCQFLYDNYVDALIVRNIGASARAILNDAHIIYFAGVIGKADDAVNKFLNGELVYEQHLEYVESNDLCSDGGTCNCSSGCGGCHGCH